MSGALYLCSENHWHFYHHYYGSLSFSRLALLAPTGAMVKKYMGDSFVIPPKKPLFHRVPQ